MSLRSGLPTIFTGINFGDFNLNSGASYTEDIVGRLVAIEKLDPGDPDFQVQASGIRIVAKDEIHIGEGVIVHADGENASLGTGGLGAPAYTIGGGESGADGGGIGDVDGLDAFGLTDGFGGSGGFGGDAGLHLGGDGGPSDGVFYTNSANMQFTMGTMGYIFSQGSAWQAQGGGGGGGGAGSSVSAVAGAGGGGAGTILLMAPIIRINGTLRANGGNGSNAALQAGGGGGGGGGCIILCYGKLIFGPGSTLEARGGNGGNGSGGGMGGKGGVAGNIYFFSASGDGLNGISLGTDGNNGTP
jgi:hypothetical protein